MQQRRIEEWSRGTSWLHHLHAVVKIAVLLTFLLAVGSMRKPFGAFGTTAFLSLAAAAFGAGVPLRALLARAAVVLPFACCFALLSALGGRTDTAALLIVRSYLSAFASLLLVAVTPMARLIEGLATLRLPGFLIQVMQFLYRYLSVLAGEAAAMRTAAACRSGQLRSMEFRRMAAIAGTLFARAWSRAEAIHRAMAVRGFEGHLPAGDTRAFHAVDAAIMLATCGGIICIRTVLP